MGPAVAGAMSDFMAQPQSGAIFMSGTPISNEGQVYAQDLDCHLKAYWCSKATQSLCPPQSTNWLHGNHGPSCWQGPCLGPCPTTVRVCFDIHGPCYHQDPRLPLTPMLVSKGQATARVRVACTATQGHCIIRAWATSTGHIWVLGCATVMSFVDVCDSCCHEDSDEKAVQNWSHPSLAASLRRTAPFHQCNTQGNRPCTSPGQHNGDDPVGRWCRWTSTEGMKVGELTLTLLSICHVVAQVRDRCYPHSVTPTTGG